MCMPRLSETIFFFRNNGLIHPFPSVYGIKKKEPKHRTCSLNFAAIPDTSESAETWLPQQQSLSESLLNEFDGETRDQNNEKSISQMQNWRLLSIVWQKSLVCSFIKVRWECLPEMVFTGRQKGEIRCH